MPIKGVTKQEENIILSILKPYFGKYKFFYYGSRVKGNFRPLSDLDILVVSSDSINYNDIEDMRLDFDESLLPYIVNLSYNVDDNFFKLIEKDLVEVN